MPVEVKGGVWQKLHNLKPYVKASEVQELLDYKRDAEKCIQAVDVLEKELSALKKERDAMLRLLNMSYTSKEDLIRKLLACQIAEDNSLAKEIHTRLFMLAVYRYSLDTSNQRQKWESKVSKMQKADVESLPFYAALKPDSHVSKELVRIGKFCTWVKTKSTAENSEPKPIKSIEKPRQAVKTARRESVNIHSIDQPTTDRSSKCLTRLTVTGTPAAAPCQHSPTKAKEDASTQCNAESDRSADLSTQAQSEVKQSIDIVESQHLSQKSSLSSASSQTDSIEHADKHTCITPSLTHTKRKVSISGVSDCSWHDIDEVFPSPSRESTTLSKYNSKKLTEHQNSSEIHGILHHSSSKRLLPKRPRIFSAPGYGRRKSDGHVTFDLANDLSKTYPCRDVVSQATSIQSFQSQSSSKSFTEPKEPEAQDVLDCDVTDYPVHVKNRREEIVYTPTAERSIIDHLTLEIAHSWEVIFEKLLLKSGMDALTVDNEKTVLRTKAGFDDKAKMLEGFKRWKQVRGQFDAVMLLDVLEAINIKHKIYRADIVNFVKRQVEKSKAYHLQSLYG